MELLEFLQCCAVVCELSMLQLEALALKVAGSHQVLPVLALDLVHLGITVPALQIPHQIVAGEVSRNTSDSGGVTEPGERSDVLLFGGGGMIPRPHDPHQETQPKARDNDD
jgi:hypothetical protein